MVIDLVTQAQKSYWDLVFTAEDLKVNTRIAGNELLWKILEDAGYKNAVAEFKPKNIIDSELVKKIYLELAASPEYLEYIELQSRDKKSEKDMLEFIFFQ